MPESATAPEVELLEDGRIVQNKKGKQTLLATYDADTENLEFESKEISDSTKLRPRILQVVGTDGDGTKPSDRKISTYSVKGFKRDDVAAGTPPRPKRTKALGDTEPDLVEWYFRYRPQEAYILYGVKLDSKGKPVLATVRRKMIATVDNRDQDDNSLEEIKTGPKTSEKGPISREAALETLKNQMIATRATHMTFLKEEVVGYGEGGEDDDEDGASPHNDGGEE